MSNEMLDWQGVLAAGTLQRSEYAAKIRDFIANERDTASLVSAALMQGDAEKARQLVHENRMRANELGAKKLAAVGMSLEMAIRAGADNTVSLKQFESVAMDTLLAMSGFLTL